jgi:hypothetical protein
VIQVTDVSQRGQVVLLKFACETPRADSSSLVEYFWLVSDDRSHTVLPRYSGPVFAYPAGLATAVTNVDCLLTPGTFDNGGHPEAVTGSVELKGKSAYQVGFVLPDEATATMVVEQLKQVHLGKLRRLSEPTSALLLFSLHRRVEATGQPDGVENLTATLSWRSKGRSAENLEAIPVFGPAYGQEQEFRRQLAESIPVREYGYTIKELMFTDDYRKALVVFSHTNDQARHSQDNRQRRPDWEFTLDSNGLRRYRGFAMQPFYTPGSANTPPIYITVVLPDK